MMQSSQLDEVIKLKYFDWDKAKCFYYVYKFNSINKASNCLHISQSALSKKIKALEEEVNCQLIIRSQRGVKPTRKGDELFSIIEETFHKLKGFNYNNVAMSHNGQKRKIKISTTQPIAAYVLNEHILNYNKLYPEVIFEIDTNDHLIDLIINDVDIAIRPYDSEAKGVQQEHIFTLEKKLYASEDYLNKYGEPKTVEDLSNHHLLSYSHPEERPYSDLQWILKLGKTNGEMHEPVYTADSLECLIEATQKGVGIFACYDNMSLVKNSGLVRILSSITAPTIRDYIIYPNHLKNDQLFIEFKTYLLSVFLEKTNS